MKSTIAAIAVGVFSWFRGLAISNSNPLKLFKKMAQGAAVL